jgi:tetratricopeptide (TPR) repeat protein
MFQPGDIVYSYLDGYYHIYKVLKLDDFGGYHLTVYQPLNHVPTPQDIPHLVPFILHVPIAQMDNAELLYNLPVTEADLEGYYEYLKQTDFRRWAEETGHDLDDVLKRANTAYQTAYYLTDEGRLEDALVKYAEAVELFPLFFEAIDNRAFVMMDLGRWEEAIDEFQRSLWVNPGGMAATFSIGECYYRLGEMTEAGNWFEKALEIDPESQIAKEWLARVR